MELIIREIGMDDNGRAAEIIRTVMPEYDCVGEAYSIHDPEVDDMYHAYQSADSRFYVIENLANGQVYGIGGFAPLKGSDGTICELQKMYFLQSIRGQGMGRRLLEHCLTEARQLGFAKMYLETVFRMKEAEALYRKLGFEDIEEALGNTGHSACDHFMVKQL
ncbi:MAG: GNAT family N-acetyltransferase [Bacteroidota bacterium]